MTVHQCHATLAAAIVVAAAALGCGKAPPQPPPAPPITIAAPPEAKVKAPLMITVDKQANPDRNGRPSQVVLRIYQLRADARFLAAELLPLYDSDEKVLGPELITVDEFELQPAEAKTIEVSLSPEARFVGAIVPFRDDRNSTWRAVVPAPQKGLTVKIDRASVSLVALP